MSELRMNAYYYEFEPTGVKEVDEILSMVAWAGRAFHYTSQWNDECGNYGPSVDPENGITPVDWIQNAANRCAKQIKEKTK